MPPVTRSKKHAVTVMDELSGLMSGVSITPKSTRKHKTPRVKKEKDISDLFSGLTLGSKSRRRRKGTRFTHKKNTQNSRQCTCYDRRHRHVLYDVRRKT